jgi:hypothetical protein
MNKKSILVIVFLCILFISGCSINIKNRNNTSETTDKTQKSGLIKAPDKLDDSESSDVIIREDPDGLFRVIIKDGNAELEYNMDKWVKLPGYDDYMGYFDIPEINGGPFSILTSDQRKFIDACAGILSPEKAGSFYNGEGMYPSLIFLMEDGTLEYTIPDLVHSNMCADMEINEYTLGPICWLKNISSISYESDGNGGMTVYAKDLSGVRYDVRVPMDLSNILWNVWVYSFDENYPYNSYIELAPDGTATLMIGPSDREGVVYYKGTYEITPVENTRKDNRMGTVTLNYYYDRIWDGEEGLERAEIIGKYYINYVDDGVMDPHIELQFIDGSPLEFDYDYKPVEYYTLWQLYTDYEYYDEGVDGVGRDVFEMIDDELIDYVISQAPEISERMNMRGGGNLKVIVPGDIREDVPNEGRCRDVWLVWYGAEEYDIIIIYTVSTSGAVYEYDSTEGWKWVDPSYHPYEKFDGTVE